MSDQSKPSVNAVQLAKALQVLAARLTLMSESDYPYKAFTAPLPKSMPLNAESFHAAAKLAQTCNKPYLTTSVDFFKNNEDPDQNSAEAIQTYRLLGAVMRATLKNLTVVYARGDDVVEVPFFVFGRMTDGTLVGLKSTAIET